MEPKRCFLTRGIFSFSLILFLVNLAQAEITNCTAITSLPYTISSQGTYCLTGNLSMSTASGNAIQINAGNVVLDLNGYTIGGSQAGAGTNAYGIYAYQRKNITIRNGTVRGFNQGIWLNDDSPYTTSQGHIIENIRADRNTIYGIVLYGLGNIIRNNLVVSTGGNSYNSHPHGVLVSGSGNRVINNDVCETKENGSGQNAYGIYATNASGLVVENNRVGNAAIGPGTSYGIYIEDSYNAMVKDNTISKMTYGIYYDGSSGLYMNNLASGCTHDFTNGTPAGTTNYSN